MVFDHDEEGRIMAREVKGSSDVEMTSSNNNNISANSGGNAENVVQISSLRAQHAAAAAAAAAPTATPPASAPEAPSGTSPNYTSTAKNDDQMSPYRVD